MYNLAAVIALFESIEGVTSIEIALRQPVEQITGHHSPFAQVVTAAVAGCSVEISAHTAGILSCNPLRHQSGDQTGQNIPCASRRHAGVARGIDECSPIG